ISSFGISGTNAHIIIEEPPTATPATAESGSAPAGDLAAAAVAVAVEVAAGAAPGFGPDDRFEFPLSARTPHSLRAAAHRLREHLTENPEFALAEVSHALRARHDFDHRAVILTTSRAGLLSTLTKLTDLPVSTTREIVELPDATLTLGQK
ncbi:hypothetical protein MXD61_05840, partial [Frankia sp. AgPm24]|uniref:CurL C-terminal domain-containing protein n=1 Tax=Frankia sp. AgPm24 TaxID=631128 RepID=UPI00200C23B4